MQKTHLLSGLMFQERGYSNFCNARKFIIFSKNRQAGLEINSKVKDLVSQVVAREDGV